MAKHLLTFHAYTTGTGNVSKSAIDKWVQARKQNFPSHDAIETKERLEEARVERGEVLENQNAFGKFRLAPLDKNKRKFEPGSTDEIDSDPSISHLQKASAKESKRQRVEGTSELIEKLLAEDIRHERNVLLQCIRYIVNHGPQFGMINTREETGLHSDTKNQ